LFAFCLRQNYCSHQFLNWWQQQSTGLLHLDGSNLAAQRKKEPTPNGVGSFLELLARFELATSSLPKMKRLWRAAVDCCGLLANVLEPQRVSGFACCSLLWLRGG